MLRKTKRIGVLTLGIIFLLLGLSGLVLPFLQGFLFLAIGLLLISTYSPSVKIWLEKHTKQHPKLHAMIEKAERWITKIIGQP